MTKKLLEDKLEPIRRKRGRDNRTIWIDDIPNEFFVQTDDLPHPPWPDFPLSKNSALNAPLGVGPETLMAWIKTLPPIEDSIHVALVLAFFDSVPVLDRKHEWLALSHKIGGTAVGYRRMVALKLEARPDAAERMRKVAIDRYDTGFAGVGWAPLSAFVSYRDAIADLGLSCEWSFPLFSEALYPVDLPSNELSKAGQLAALDAMVHGDVPPSSGADRTSDAQTLVDRLAIDAPRLKELGGGPFPYGGFLGRATLAWLSPNSD